MIESKAFVPDLVFMEWMIPEMDGKKTASQIQDLVRRRPVLSHSIRRLRRFFIPPFGDYNNLLHKPFFSRQLTEKIRKRLEKVEEWCKNP